MNQNVDGHLRRARGLGDDDHRPAARFPGHL
jgi:hypothetical protein